MSGERSGAKELTAKETKALTNRREERLELGRSLLPLN
jgi:hypothetical protein